MLKWYVALNLRSFKLDIYGQNLLHGENGIKDKKEERAHTGPLFLIRFVVCVIEKHPSGSMMPDHAGVGFEEGFEHGVVHIFPRDRSRRDDATVFQLLRHDPFFRCSLDLFDDNHSSSFYAELEILGLTVGGQDRF